MRPVFLSLFALFITCLSPLAPAQTPVWQVGSPAPAVVAYDELGNVQRLSDYLGSYVVFDVSAPWCTPCFELAQNLAQIKGLLSNQGVNLVVYTVLEQDPLQHSFPLRSQALAWKDAFPETDVVVAWHRGLTDFINQIPAARSLLGSPATSVFPTFAIIDPSGVVQQIVQGAPSTDTLLAYFLSNQPPVDPVTPPAVGLSDDRAKLTIHVGGRSGQQSAPFFDDSTAYLVPKIQRGTLSHTYGLGISKETAPGQEIWTLHYDTGPATGPNDHGIPANASIKFEVSGVRWLGTPGVLPIGQADLYLYDNVLPPTRVTAPISYRNGHVEVGPFKVGAGIYYYRYIQAKFYFARQNVRELAVFGADETERVVTSTDDMDTLVAQWRSIENAMALSPNLPELNLALDQIRELWKHVTHARAAVISNSEKRLFLGMLARMKKEVYDERLQLRHSR